MRSSVVGSSAVEALGRGDALGAARFFIDFWIAPGAFDRMPERNQAAIAEAGRNIQRWKDALFDEPTPLAAFAQLDVPVLLITGARSPLSSRAVAPTQSDGTISSYSRTCASIAVKSTH